MNIALHNLDDMCPPVTSVDAPAASLGESEVLAAAVDPVSSSAAGISRLVWSLQFGGTSRSDDERGFGPSNLGMNSVVSESCSKETQIKYKFNQMFRDGFINKLNAAHTLLVF